MLNTNSNSTNTRYGYRIFGKGVSVSNDTILTGMNNNDLIIGKSGSSKSGSIVHPFLKTVSDCSVIISDAKKLFHDQFKEELEGRGYRVFKIDFTNPSEGYGYNPLSYIHKDKDGNYCESDIAGLASAIQPVLSKDEPIWESSAQSLIQFLISFCLEAFPEDQHNMIEVCKLYHRYINKDICFTEWLVDNPDSFAAMKYAEFRANKDADKMYASILGFVNNALKPFCVKEASYIFKDNEMVDIESIGREKTVVFINFPDYTNAWDSVINLFYYQAFSVLMQQGTNNPDHVLDVPTRFIMDDFASGAVIPDFNRTISNIRSRDIYATLIIQSKSQLESMYGKDDATTIFDNCDHILFLGGNDLETASYVGTRANKSPETVLCMERNKAYLIEAGKLAELIDKIPPYSFGK